MSCSIVTVTVCEYAGPRSSLSLIKAEQDCSPLHAVLICSEKKDKIVLQTCPISCLHCYMLCSIIHERCIMFIVEGAAQVAYSCDYRVILYPKKTSINQYVYCNPSVGSGFCRVATEVINYQRLIMVLGNFYIVLCCMAEWVKCLWHPSGKSPVNL